MPSYLMSPAMFRQTCILSACFLAFFLVGKGETDEPKIIRLGGASYRFRIDLPPNSDYGDKSGQVAVKYNNNTSYPTEKVIVRQQEQSGNKGYNVQLADQGVNAMLDNQTIDIVVKYKVGGSVQEASLTLSFLANGVANLATGKIFTGEAIAAASNTSQAEKAVSQQLVDSVIDLAQRAKVPGVAYYDHEPRLSCRTLANIFRKAIDQIESKKMKEELTGSDEKHIREFLKSEVNEFYQSRPRLESDWAPFLEKVMEMVEARNNSSDKSIAVDLTSRASVELVFESLIAAFTRMERMHRDGEWYSEDIVRQFREGANGYSGSGGGGSSMGSGASACHHCRRGHRHCRCARLLFR